MDWSGWHRNERVEWVEVWLARVACEGTNTLTRSHRPIHPSARKAISICELRLDGVLRVRTMGQSGNDTPTMKRATVLRRVFWARRPECETAYSPECVKGGFYELCGHGVLRSSHRPLYGTFGLHSAKRFRLTDRADRRKVLESRRWGSMLVCISRENERGACAK